MAVCVVPAAYPMHRSGLRGEPVCLDVAPAVPVTLVKELRHSQTSGADRTPSRPRTQPLMLGQSPDASSITCRAMAFLLRCRWYRHRGRSEGDGGYDFVAARPCPDAGPLLLGARPLVRHPHQ